MRWNQTDGRSDYDHFLAASITSSRGIAARAGGVKIVEGKAVFGGEAAVAYDIGCHAAGDNVTNLNLGCWVQMTKSIAHLSPTYARGFDSLLLRNEAPRAKKMVVAKRKMSEKAMGGLWVCKWYSNEWRSWRPIVG